MDLYYKSTRNSNLKVTASEAILKGLAPDGGLFVPEKLPVLGKSMEELKDLNYQDTAYEVMKCFLTDFTEEELRNCIEKAYDSKFDDEAIAPLVKVEDTYYLELFHGATIAFKDMALSILPHLMTTSAKKNQVKNEIVILTATSGDTGKDVVAIHGNFDNAQSGVKQMFEDQELAKELADKGYQFSSANSINIGRLVPQVAYYVYAYTKLLANGEIKDGEKINVVVPTGNFGNILAAYYAKNLGVPIAKLICASNDNKVLYDFFQTGTYDKNREFVLTTSPSMDILISSNLERLIYLICGEDSEKTKELMEELKTTGKYTITPEMKEKLADFAAGYSTEEETAESIHDTYQKTGYVMDTHTAVAAHVCGQYRAKSGDQTKCVIASTASPYKFVKNVMSAIDAENANADEFDLLPKLQEVSGVPMPQAIKDILDAKVLHDLECDADKMKDTVKGILGV